MNNFSIYFDNIIKMHKSGNVVSEIAKQFNVSKSFVYKVIKQHGETFVSRRIADHPKSADVIADYISGISENGVSIKHGIQRDTVKRILAYNNIKRRNQSEAETLKWSQMTKDKRLKQVAKANHTMRNMPKEFHASNSIKQAISKEKSLSKVGDFEMIFMDFLNKLGHRCTPQLAFGAYNIDIAIGNTAIEIHNNTAHPHNHPYYRQRIVRLLESDWNVIYVKTIGKVDVKRATSKLSQMIDLIQSNKPTLGQYGVIRGSGDFIATGCLNGNNLSIVNASDGFFKAIE
jgi:hypothetical protein